MGIAITTRFNGPTNSKGSRYTASAGGKAGGGSDRLVRNGEHEMSPLRNRAAVAKALAVKLEWEGLWMAGGLNGSDVVFVRAPVSQEKAVKMAAMMSPAFVDEDWFFVDAKPIEPRS